MIGDDVMYYDVPRCTMHVNCDAEMYCDALQWINVVWMLDSGSSLYYIKPQWLYIWYNDLLMINEVGIVMPHTNNPQ